MQGKGYSIGERRGLIDKDHVKKMGNSRWLYSWLTARQTGVNRDGEGVVLHGKMITCRWLSRELGKSEKTVYRWLHRLALKGYLRVVHRQYGNQIFISRQKKFMHSSEHFSTDSDWTKMSTLGVQSESVHSEQQVNNNQTHTQKSVHSEQTGQKCPLSNVHSEPQVPQNEAVIESGVHSQKYSTNSTSRKKEQYPPSAIASKPSEKTTATAAPKPKPEKSEVCKAAEELDSFKREVLDGRIAGIAAAHNANGHHPPSAAELERRRQKQKADLAALIGKIKPLDSS